MMLRKQKQPGRAFRWISHEGLSEEQVFLQVRHRLQPADGREVMYDSADTKTMTVKAKLSL